MMEFISQYQYPLIGLGVLIIMGLIGYMADQKETGKIAESKKLRKAKLEEKKKLKEQQKAEKMKLQEEKRAEKAKQKEEKAQAKEKAEKNESNKVEEPVVVPVEDTVATEVSIENNVELVEEQTAGVEENSDVFIIEEPAPVIAENVVQEDIQNETQQTETIVFEPAIQKEDANDSVITESGEDLSVPFAFSTDAVAKETPQQDVLKSESSVEFSSLLKEVQSEEASLNSKGEDDFLKSINMVNSNDSVSGMAAEDDDALKVFMQPNVSSSEKDDMTSDSLDAWKL